MKLPESKEFGILISCDVRVKSKLLIKCYYFYEEERDRKNLYRIVDWDISYSIKEVFERTKEVTAS